MARKTKIRSMRFSEELEDLINQQVGESFSAKFERLVYNCYMLAPQKEKEIQELDRKISSKKVLLLTLHQNYEELHRASIQLTSKLKFIMDTLDDLDALEDVEF